MLEIEITYAQPYSKFKYFPFAKTGFEGKFSEEKNYFSRASEKKRKTSKLTRFIHLFLFSGSQSKQEQEYANMMQLLQKFRIQVQFLKMVPEVNSRPSSNEWQNYVTMQKEFETSEEPDEPTPFITKNLCEDTKIKRITRRQVRIGQMVREYSADASIVIINIPLPKQIVQGHYQYMCWLETLSHGLPPTILMRGNQESVITFYS